MAAGFDTWAAVFDRAGRDTPMGRLLVFGEQRYWLLTGLEAFGGIGTVASTEAIPEAWEAVTQLWRRRLETNARLKEGIDPVGAAIDGFRATIIAAFASTFRRMSNPNLRYVELWCTGSVRRVELLGTVELHGEHCACKLFNDTVFELEEVVKDLDPWVKWAVPNEGKVWIFVHGVCGPQVIRLIHGVPSSLEDVAGFGHASETPFMWGPANGAVYLLASALLEDVTGERPDPEVWECFGDTVLSAFDSSAQFVLTASEILEWLNAPLRRRGWPTKWKRKFSSHS